MLHFTNIVKGKILYDGVDISAIPRHKLREALTIIPQEATLFSGTVGSNLDPSGNIPSSRLEKAIESCANIASFQFHDRTENEPMQRGWAVDGNYEPNPTENTPLLQNSHDGAILAVATAARGLSPETLVLARGENFSHGQRQVLSLCRALVRHSKLMLLDEATASMDYNTDQGIQTILREELDASNTETQRRTLVTIAHRLRTIADYDKIVVLSAGQVIEVGSPAGLYRAQGQFYEMVRHSGDSDDLERVLSES